MKNIVLLISLMALILTGCQNIEFTGTFSTLPLKPNIKEPILVKFLADGTKLSESNSIKMVLYQYNVDLLSTTEIEMNKEGAGWTGEFTPDGETKGVIVIFKENKIIENNNSKGFVIYLNDTAGNRLPEAIAGYQVALSQLGAEQNITYSSWSNVNIDIESEIESVVLNFEKTFEKHPEIKSTYLDFYIYSLSALGTKEANSKISDEFERLQNRSDLSENESVVLAKYLSENMKKDKSKNYKEMVSEKYPKNKFSSIIYINEMINKESPDEFKIEFAKFAKEYPNSELLPDIAYFLVKKFIDEDNVYGAIVTVDEYKEIVHPEIFLYSTKKLQDADKDDFALKIALIGVEGKRIDLLEPKSVHPKYLSSQAWDKYREGYFVKILNNAARLQSDLNNKDEAIKLAEEIESITEGENIQLNEFYSSLLLESGQFEKVKEVGSRYLAMNRSNDAMLGNLKTAYTKLNGSEIGFEDYISSFAASGEDEFIEQTKLEMINEPAPEFELNDLEGNVVKLSDYKGKTIIIDFWATWCKPCTKSFPAREELIEKYKENKNVIFLFVNAGEYGDNKVEKVKKFIQDNNYNLTVLMDLDSEVMKSFKAESFPTRYVIDRNNNIKFKSVGYPGSTKQIVRELTAMIEIVNS